MGFALIFALTALMNAAILRAAESSVGRYLVLRRGEGEVDVEVGVNSVKLQRWILSDGRCAEIWRVHQRNQTGRHVLSTSNTFVGAQHPVSFLRFVTQRLVDAAYISGKRNTN